MVLWHPSLLAHSSTILTTTLLPVQGLPEPAVRWARALHPVATATDGAVVPERVARRCDHVAHVLVAVARRRCRDKLTHARK